MEDKEKLAVGVDIGGTKTNIGIITANGRVKELKNIDTNANNPEAIKENLIKFISILIKEHKNICGIGIAAAGRVIFDKKIIGYATDNLKDWTEYPLVDELNDKFNLPIIIDNDVNAALFSELNLNDSIKKEDNNIIFLTIGTGLGGALALNNNIIRGKTGSAGEFGHMMLYPGGKPCNCGKYGCAEQYISGKAFKRRLKKKFRDTLVHFDKSDLTDETIQAEIKKDNVLYRSTLREMTEDLTLLLENLKNIFDFDLCILGGSFSVYRKIMLKIIKKEFEKYNHKYYEDPEFMFSEMGNKAGVIGAGLMVLNQKSLYFN